MLDEYLIGAYHRNSPEAEVPIINYQRTENRLGGAANVALNLQSLGLNPILVALIGEDATGENITELCNNKKLTHHFITVSDRPTTKKQRIVDENFKQFLRVDFEETKNISEVIEVQVEKLLSKLLSSNELHGIILQDYNKGLLTSKLIQWVLRFADKNNIPSFADPKHLNFGELAIATVFKPNLKELSAYFGSSILPSIDEIYQALKGSSLSMGKYIFVTLAEKGIYCLDTTTNNQTIIPGYPLKNPDVSGAGDSVLAALVMAFLENLKVEEMGELANRAGSIVCAKKGVSLITKAELAQKPL